MNRFHRLLLFVLGFAALGLLMSGYLSYRNYFSSGCSQGPLSRIVTCGGPKAVKIFGQPTCIYGLAMFLAVFIATLVGLNRPANRNILTTLVVLGVAGTAFSGYLVIYEVFFLKFGLAPVPACVFGFIFYLGILLSSIVAGRQFKGAGTTMPPSPVT